MAQRRVVLGLILTFAAAALGLAATGLYGVMAYAVTTRRREFGVRMAFGATPQGLLRQVLRDGLRVTAAGVVLGLFGAVSAARVLSSQLYQVTPTDPLVLVGTALTVVLVASCASLVRDDVRRTLASTDLGLDDLAVWRKGLEHARRTTPLGYFGDPAAASAAEGESTLRTAAETAADAIVARLQGKK